MIRVRDTTIPVIISSFIAGALAAIFVVLIVRDHASTDESLRAGRPVIAARPSADVVPAPRPDLPVSVSPALPTPPVDPSAVEELRQRDLLVPVAGVEARSLRSSFQESRTGGRTHEAMDILAPRNTIVRAVSDGTIAKLFRSEAGGLTIYEFDHGERFAFYYAHLERYAPGLREHDRIVRGQTIGFVGTSGNAPPDTPHLHFAIFKLGPERRWWEGDAIDPFDVWRE